MSVHPRQKRWDLAGETLIALGTLSALYQGYRTLSAHFDLAGLITVVVLLLPSVLAIGFLWWFFRVRRRIEEEEERKRREKATS